MLKSKIYRLRSTWSSEEKHIMPCFGFQIYFLSSIYQILLNILDNFICSCYGQHWSPLRFFICRYFFTWWILGTKKKKNTKWLVCSCESFNFNLRQLIKTIANLWIPSDRLQFIICHHIVIASTFFAGLRFGGSHAKFTVMEPPSYRHQRNRPKCPYYTYRCP